MNKNDKFDVTENRIISGRLTPDWRIQKDKYISLQSYTSLFVMRRNEKGSVSA